MTPTLGALAEAVDAVVGQDLDGGCPALLQAQIAAVAPQVQRLTGFVALAAGRLHKVTGGQVATEDGGSRSVVGWVAESSHDSPSASGRLLRTATLLETMPLVGQAVLDGSITWAHGVALSRLVGQVDDDRLVESQASLVEVATWMDPVQLGMHVRHLLATWVEPALEADDAAARAKRSWQTRSEADGTVTGRFRLAAEDAETVLSAIEPLARKAGLADARSAAQRRADAFVDVCEQVLRHGDLPDAGGQRPNLTYALPADWAARQAGQNSCPFCNSCPLHRRPGFADTVAAALPGQPGVPAEHGCAVAAWTGPQTRARIETMLCDARINRVLLDSVGQVSHLESLTGEVTIAQRRALAARDLGCAARGCTRPPAMCDAHHLTARADGGATTLSNMVLLCRRHHVLWHLGKLTHRDLHVPWLTGHTSGSDPPHE